MLRVTSCGNHAPVHTVDLEWEISAPPSEGEGRIEVIGKNIYGENVDIVQLRKKVGMVFQRPNPPPVSIRDNILYGYKLHVNGCKLRKRAVEDEIVEGSLRQLRPRQRLVAPAGRKPGRCSVCDENGIQLSPRSE
jgi:phosphate transport system ATP-binding protein